jgi:Leucine-rich repeat (LRR) protein
MPDPGFRAYCLEKGYIAEINPSDNNYVKISSAGKAATTLNMNREGYYGRVTNYKNLDIGGMSVSGGFGKIPSLIFNDSLSDVDLSRWAAIEDLTGIEAFSNLKSLHLNGNKLMSLDLSQNKKLEYLDAESNQISGVTFDNPELIYIDLLNSRLSSIDVTGCSPSLRVLMVTGYTTLTGSGGTYIGAGQGMGVRVINQNISAQGYIRYQGNLSFNMIYIEIREPVDDKVIRKLLQQQGADL